MTQLKRSIGLVGFEPKEAGMLEVLLGGSDSQGFSVASQSTASALLIDYDIVSNNIHQMARLQSDLGNRPCIVVSAYPHSIDFGNIILSRPLSFDGLKGALRELRIIVDDLQGSFHRPVDETPVVKPETTVAASERPLKLDKVTLASWVAEAKKEEAHAAPQAAKKTASKPSVKKPVQQQSANAKSVHATASHPPKPAFTEGEPVRHPAGAKTARPEPAPPAVPAAKKRDLLDWNAAQKQELELQCCGHYDDINPQDMADRKRITINLQGQFITLAREAVSLANREGLPVQVSGIPGLFVYLPDIQQFAFNLDNELLLQTARSRFGVGELQLQERPDLTDVDFPRAKMDELLWTLSLITVQGRVPDYLDISGEMKLVRAPEFERLLSIPYSRSIARLWVSRSYSALDIAKILAIPQRFVFSFMVAADTVGLFERKLERK